MIVRPSKSALRSSSNHIRHFSRNTPKLQQLQPPPPEPPRINQLGIQYLSEALHKKVFTSTSTTDYLHPQYPALLRLAKYHLEQNQLLNKKTVITNPINIDNFPDLVGKNTLDEHFFKIGMEDAEPYLSMSNNFTKPKSKLPPIPKQWLFQAGWTRYKRGKKPESVPYPLEDELVFDVEVLYKKSQYSVLATCASVDAWYGWVSPFLINYSQDQSYNNWNHLIPMNCMDTPKLIVGYNVSYDRARILEEYNINQSKAFYLDAMALHVSISGICSQQRPKWMKYKKMKESTDNEIDEENSPGATLDDQDRDSLVKELESELSDDPWLNKGAANSLANVYEFHCGEKLDKSDREYFSSEDPMEIINKFQELMTYCAGDVASTFTLTKKLFPEFREKIPHPVSFAALKHLGTLVLPTTKDWNKYIETAESIYQENRSQVIKNLEERAIELIRYIEEKDDSLIPNYQEDPWLCQLNWTIKQPRLKQDGQPVANQPYMIGYPEWYRDLFRVAIKGEKKMNLTIRSRLTPILLRLKWEGYPLFWTDIHGWCFQVPFNERVIDQLKSKNYIELPRGDLLDYEDILKSDVLFKVPHPDGAGKRCTIIMSKSYSRYFSDGTLTSEYNYASQILSLNSEASYWMGNRKRIMDQFVVFNDPDLEANQFFENKQLANQHKDMGIILPKLCPMGTVTRRATENTWLTASNAKKNRIGSELKSLIKAPQGYCFVGADVDSEELWIASLVGDSMFKIHGGTALGWMTLEGDKNEKTDLHSKTSEILGISRGDAKVFNYGRIYGAGVKFATQLLKQFNPKLSDDESGEIARELYARTKGQISHSAALKGKIYYGGSESIMFNALEAIAYQSNPKTPVLGASITDALTAKNLNKNSYLTSRTNWTIQSSGVDYLHLLIVSMSYLVKKYKVNARLALTVHDELRYLVREEDKYKAALLLQISNVWTRAMFCEQLGIKEVPQSAAFFSEVDIDHVLRKEVGMDCVTPSNPVAIPPGESLTILKLLDKTGHGNVLSSSTTDGNGNGNLSSHSINYVYREPFITQLDNDLNMPTKIAKVKVQVSANKQEWSANIAEFKRIKRESYISEAFTQVRSSRKRLMEIESNIVKGSEPKPKPKPKKRSTKSKSTDESASTTTITKRRKTTKEFGIDTISSESPVKVKRFSNEGSVITLPKRKLVSKTSGKSNTKENQESSTVLIDDKSSNHKESTAKKQSKKPAGKLKVKAGSTSGIPIEKSSGITTTNASTTYPKEKEPQPQHRLSPESVRRSGTSNSHSHSNHKFNVKVPSNLGVMLNKGRPQLGSPSPTRQKSHVNRNEMNSSNFFRRQQRAVNVF
ncbi:mitochondrial DNA polymerase catalytic subunit [Scheffersomyces amazonensis]|uniref:mitochondrial DNA polymerase catalytic subunit n=1 Tax=Scheffersomyces amazonensis TaxID=1078765 RepID=UPI00315DAC3E